MTAKEIACAALADIGIGVYLNVNDAKGAHQYIVFVVADERPELCGDDEDMTEVCYLAVHYYCRCEADPIKRIIRRCLRKAGFVITSTTELYEGDTRYNHVIVSAEISGGIDD